MKRQKSFTLIEMLIVIVIIGILAAALVPRLQSVQARARDTKRKTDLRQIYNANEIYHLDNNIYPQPTNPTITYAYGAIGYVSSKHLGFRIAGLSGVMNSIPLDPRNNSTSISYVTGHYAYDYGNVNYGAVGRYDLITQLENPSDPERCQIKQYVDAGGGSRCGGGTSMIYSISPSNMSKH